MHLLVIEDERALCETIVRSLRRQAYSVDCCYDGEKALELLGVERYDLVLLEGFKDSGWPKIEVVRKEISDTPVSFQPLAVVGDIPGADFGLEDAQALADWLVAQMPGL